MFFLTHPFNKQVPNQVLQQELVLHQWAQSILLGPPLWRKRTGGNSSHAQRYIITNFKWGMKEKDRVVREVWTEMVPLKEVTFKLTEDHLCKCLGSGKKQGGGEGEESDRVGGPGEGGMALAGSKWKGPQGAELLADHLDPVKAGLQALLGPVCTGLSFPLGHNTWSSYGLYSPRQCLSGFFS